MSTFRREQIYRTPTEVAVEPETFDHPPLEDDAALRVHQPSPSRVKVRDHHLFDSASVRSLPPNVLSGPTTYTQLDTVSNSESLTGGVVNYSFQGSMAGRTEATYTPESTCYMLPSPSERGLLSPILSPADGHHVLPPIPENSHYYPPAVLERSIEGKNGERNWETQHSFSEGAATIFGESPAEFSVASPDEGMHGDTRVGGDTVLETPPAFRELIQVADRRIVSEPLSRASTGVFSSGADLSELEDRRVSRELPPNDVPPNLMQLTLVHSTTGAGDQSSTIGADPRSSMFGSENVDGEWSETLPGALIDTPPTQNAGLVQTRSLRTTNRGFGVGGVAGAARGSLNEEGLSPQALSAFVAETGGADDEVGNGMTRPFTLTPTSLVAPTGRQHHPANFRMSESAVASQFTNDGEDAPRWIPMSRAGSQVGDVYDCADLENFLKGCEGSMYDIHPDVLIDCLLLKLPVEILRYIIDYYLAIYHHNSLRCVSKVFNMLVTTNCSLWHRRLPFVFEQDFLEDELVRCRLYSVIQGIHEGEIPMARLATTYCFQRCCHDVWQRNKIMFHERVEMEKLEFEEMAYASYVFQGMTFPSAGSTVLGIFLMVLTFLLFLSFNFLVFIDLQPVYVAFLPLWCFFALCYPLMYLFFCHSSIEPLVLSIIVSIGVNLTAILAYFYRIVADEAAMSWISCLTPTLLCIACCATYIFLLCHRWIKSAGSSRTVIGLSLATALTPILLLIFLLLFAAEADHALVIPESERQSPTLSPSSSGMETPTPSDAGVSPVPTATAASIDLPVQGTLRLSGLFLAAFISILICNVVYAIRRAGFQELREEERVTTAVILGYVAAATVLLVLSMMIFVNVQGLVLFATYVSSLCLFSLSSILNISMKKSNFGFHIQLFPLNEG